MTIALVILLLVVLLPTLGGAVAALALGADLAGFGRLLAVPGVATSIATSVWTGAAAMVLSVMLAHGAVALAVAAGRRRLLNGMALPFLALPHLAVAIGLVLVLAPSGLLLRVLSPGVTGFTVPPDWFTIRDPYGLSLLLGLVVKETAFLILVLFAALGQVPAYRLLMQARSLGYGLAKAWLIAVVPRLHSQIRLPLAAVLVFGVTNVEMAIPLGPDLPPTFAVMLWHWFTDPAPDVNQLAHSGALLLLLVAVATVAAAFVSGIVLRGIWRRAATSGKRRRRDRPVRAAFVSAGLATWCLGALALVAIAIRSPGGLWRFPAVLPEPATSGPMPLSGIFDAAAGMTVMVGGVTAALSVALALAAAEYLHGNRSAMRRLGVLLFVPLLLPQMSFLFGVQVLFASIRVDGTVLAVVWCHLLYALPYAWGVVASARMAIDPRYARVARTLGAGPVRAWATVSLPLLVRAGILALALSFSVSSALYLPTLFAGAGRVATAATEAAAAAATGTMSQASRHALALAVLPLLAFTIAFTVRALVYRDRRGVPS